MTSSKLDRIDHVALAVSDIAQAVEWYTRTLHCEVRYQDSTWALLGFANMSLALVVPSQHPPHLGVFRADAAAFGLLQTHRDGTRSCYLRDPSGNTLEVLAAE
ncbi:MAG: VOC family protein [Bryobacteraceae bacterium]